MFSRGLHVYNDDLYVIWNYSIKIWDLTDPNIFVWPPVHLSLPNLTWISADGNLAFASRGQSGISIIDRANRDTAFVVDTYDTPGIARHLAPFRDYLYNQYICVADNDSLQILQVVEVGINDEHLAPREFTVVSNYPNPFNSSTVIEYDLAVTSEVSIGIFDIQGRRLETIEQGSQPAGAHSVIWDAGGQSSGIYFYRIKAGDKIETRKMVLIK